MSHIRIDKPSIRPHIRRKYDPDQNAHRKNYTPWPLDSGWLKIIPKAHKFQFGPDSYVVQSGDSYWRISENYYGHGKYWKQIKAANGNKSTIHPGESLNIPMFSIPYMDAFINTGGDERKIKNLLGQLPESDWLDFISNLDPAIGKKHASLLQKIEVMRTTGKTFDEIASLQLTYLEGKATAAGKSVGNYLKGEAAARGYGGNAITWWINLKPAQQKRWTARFHKMVAKIKKTAPADVKGIISMAESKGGGFEWAPAETERLGAFGYTKHDWKLHAGKEWLEAAEKNQASVYANISHEMGGHNVYGHSLSWDIMKGAQGKMDPAEKTIANSGAKSLYSAYGYMETEIFAELYEDKYDRIDNPTDHPFDFPGDPIGRFEDVENKLQLIKDNFEASIAEALVRGLWIRAKFDNFISDATRTKFKDRIKKVFSISVP